MLTALVGVMFGSTPSTALAAESPVELNLETFAVQPVQSSSTPQNNVSMPSSNQKDPEGGVNDPLACNCWAYLKATIPDLPNTKTLVPNTDPHIGAVALFQYKNGMRHYAMVTGLSEGQFELQEANYRHCQYSTRVVSYTDPSLLGFWAPSISP